MLHSFASLCMRYLPLLWFVALAATIMGFLVAIGGGALMARAEAAELRAPAAASVAPNLP
ncbi:MAG TPA: hypothetical protein VFS11_11050 [Gemmatimonadales bacterium]|nr:hypothetical protein [Gemmatimonadales bacterium]